MVEVRAAALRIPAHANPLTRRCPWCLGRPDVRASGRSAHSLAQGLPKQGDVRVPALRREELGTEAGRLLTFPKSGGKWMILVSKPVLLLSFTLTSGETRPSSTYQPTCHWGLRATVLMLTAGVTKGACVEALTPSVTTLGGRK